MDIQRDESETKMEKSVREEQFARACNKIIEQERQRNGIGTLGEKTLHAVLKQYYEPNEENQEIRIDGYVADILKNQQVIEIQTSGFHTMRRKLDVFLQKYQVTIVYPIPHVKWLVWLDEETGEATNRRKSPKTGTVYQAFRELYKIKMYLRDPNLHFCFPLIDMEEQRLLNGWSQNRKRGSSRYDRLPLSVHEEICIDGIEEFQKMIPPELPEEFTSKDFSKKAKITLAHAQTALNVLTYVEAVQRVGKQGNAIIYQRTHHPDCGL